MWSTRNRSARHADQPEQPSLRRILCRHGNGRRAMGFARKTRGMVLEHDDIMLAYGTIHGAQLGGEDGGRLRYVQQGS